ncbi:MAG: M48 family metalloprotease [Coriobacteriia bacterium]
MVAPRPIRPQALWARVDANRIRLAVFVAAFVSGSALLLALALVAVPGSLVGWAMIEVAEATRAAAYFPRLALWVLVAMTGLLALGALIAAVQIANAEDWVRNRFAGRDATEAERDGLLDVIGDMGIAAGLSGTPRLVVFETDAVNACAMGMHRANPVLGFTRGMLDTLTRDEMRAVVATLVARITAGDIVFGTALAALMGPLKAVRESKGALGTAAGGCLDGCGDLGCSNLGGADDGCGCLFDSLGGDDAAGGCLGAIAIAVFVAVVIAITYVAVVSAAWIVTLWGRLLHRTTYEKADAEGMLLLKDPVPMLSALEKCVSSTNLVGTGDSSYDSIFYVATGGTPRVDAIERRRFDRLREVLGTDGLAAGIAGDAPITQAVSGTAVSTPAPAPPVSQSAEKFEDLHDQAGIAGERDVR